MLQLFDETPFVSALSVFPDPAGVDTLYVTLKATFALDAADTSATSSPGQLSIAEEQLPLNLTDEYWGEPGASSLKYAADIHPSKLSTDVALVGSAHSGTEGSSVSDLLTSLSVGPVRKEIRVVGDREWTGRLLGSKSSLEPFDRMPLTYERAYGGSHVVNEKKGRVRSVDANPVGQGFRPRRRRAEIKGGIAPNLIDPNDPKRPASYGFVAPTWKPRVDYAGTYDADWERSRAPFLPHDFDSRFFSAAHPDLTADGYLTGGEAVEMVNLSPAGTLRFTLPRCELSLRVDVDGEEHSPPLHLETVLFEPDDDRLSMVWRASLPCDKKVLKVERVEIAGRCS